MLRTVEQRGASRQSLTYPPFCLFLSLSLSLALSLSFSLSICKIYLFFPWIDGFLCLASFFVFVWLKGRERRERIDFPLRLFCFLCSFPRFLSRFLSLCDLVGGRWGVACGEEGRVLARSSCALSSSGLNACSHPLGGKEGVLSSSSFFREKERIPRSCGC